jgi:hypothetical protein
MYSKIKNSRTLSGSKDEPETVTMNAKDIQLSPVVHDSLTSEQLEKVKKIHSVFSEVDSSSLETTITNFRRDMNPDKEIAIWLSMADAYEKFTSNNSKIDLNKKQDAFKLILLRSMMPDDEAINQGKIKYLSDKEIREILRYYNESPTPVTVQ